MRQELSYSTSSIIKKIVRLSFSSSERVAFDRKGQENLQREQERVCDASACGQKSVQLDIPMDFHALAHTSSGLSKLRSKKMDNFYPTKYEIFT